MSRALCTRARGPCALVDRWGRSSSCHCTEPAPLFLARSITAATASSTAAYSLASVLSRATRASSWRSKSTRLCGGGSGRSYCSRSAIPIFVPTARKGRLALKSSCRMLEPLRGVQSGLASAVPGTVRRRSTVTAVLTAPGRGGVVLALASCACQHVRLKVTR